MGWRPANRFEIYALHSSLHVGMPQEKLEGMLSAVADPKVQHAWTSDRRNLTVWAPLGLMDTCYLLVQVQDGKVLHATVRGERGRLHRLDDAPPDF